MDLLSPVQHRATMKSSLLVVAFLAIVAAIFASELDTYLKEAERLYWEYQQHIEPEEQFGEDDIKLQRREHSKPCKITFGFHESGHRIIFCDPNDNDRKNSHFHCIAHVANGCKQKYRGIIYNITGIDIEDGCDMG